MTIKREAYGLGATLSKGLGRAAAYLSTQSEKAAVHLSERETKARAEEAAEAARRNAILPSQGQDVAVQEVKKDEDIADTIRGLLATARAKGPQVAQEVRTELRSTLNRVEVAIAAYRAAPGTPPASEEIIDAEIAPSDPKADEPIKQTHF